MCNAQQLGSHRNLTRMPEFLRTGSDFFDAPRLQTSKLDAVPKRRSTAQQLPS
jgi:hypothetical protein